MCAHEVMGAIARMQAATVKNLMALDCVWIALILCLRIAYMHPLSLMQEVRLCQNASVCACKNL